MRKYYVCILLILFAFSGANAQQEGKLYAVIVGVSEYEDPQNNLSYSHRDAMEMKDLFLQLTPESSLRLLTNQRATRDNILRAANELFSRAQPKDMIVFYFSGHGGDGCFYGHDKAFYFSALKEAFRQSKAERKVILADACYSGTLRTPASEEQIGNDSLGSDVLLFLSSRSDQTSQETIFIRNGAFTYFLLAGLKGGADVNRDKIVTAKELFLFVNPKVKERTNNAQVPVMWGRFDDDMVILDWN